MSGETGEKKALKGSVRHVIRILQSIKKHRKTLCDSFDDEALHDIRVAARKFEAIDALSAKTLGVCLDEERRSKLKLILKSSSALRDMQEFSKFAPQETDEQIAKREAAGAAFLEIAKDTNLEKELFDRYKTVYAILKTASPNLQNLREAALEGVLESLSQTSKRYKKEIERASPEFDALHSIRKKCKKSRYQFDFLFDSNNEGSMLCKRIQEGLGKINDYRVWLTLSQDEELRETLALKLKAALLAAKEEPFANKEQCAKIAKELRERMAIS